MLAQLQVSELTWALPQHEKLLHSAINILKSAELPLCLA